MAVAKLSETYEQLKLAQSENSKLAKKAGKLSTSVELVNNLLLQKDKLKEELKEGMMFSFNHFFYLLKNGYFLVREGKLKQEINEKALVLSNNIEKVEKLLEQETEVCFTKKA
jgi:hypothetical protein